jgi:hypothetical protein
MAATATTKSLVVQYQMGAETFDSVTFRVDVVKETRKEVLQVQCMSL